MVLSRVLVATHRFHELTPSSVVWPYKMKMLTGAGAPKVVFGANADSENNPIGLTSGPLLRGSQQFRAELGQAATDLWIPCAEELRGFEKANLKVCRAIWFDRCGIKRVPRFEIGCFLDDITGSWRAPHRNSQVGARTCHAQVFARSRFHYGQYKAPTNR